MDKPKTVRVRVAVVVDEAGDWSSAGWRMATGKKTETHDDEMQGVAMDGVNGRVVGYHWIEADIPIPQATTHVVEPDADAGGEVEGSS